MREIGTSCNSWNDCIRNMHQGKIVCGVDLKVEGCRRRHALKGMRDQNI